MNNILTMRMQRQIFEIRAMEFTNFSKGSVEKHHKGHTEGQVEHENQRRGGLPKGCTTVKSLTTLHEIALRELLPK